MIKQNRRRTYLDNPGVMSVRLNNPQLENLQLLLRRLEISHEMNARPKLRSMSLSKKLEIEEKMMRCAIKQQRRSK